MNGHLIRQMTHSVTHTMSHRLYCSRPHRVTSTPFHRIAAICHLSTLFITLCICIDLLGITIDHQMRWPAQTSFAIVVIFDDRFRLCVRTTNVCITSPRSELHSHLISSHSLFNFVQHLLSLPASIQFLIRRFYTSNHRLTYRPVNLIDVC